MHIARRGHPIHGFGYIADPKGHTYNNFLLHPAAKASYPSAVDFSACCPPIWDQGQTGSCTGHGMAGAITTTFAARKVDLPAPAWPRGLYTAGRIIDRVPVNGTLPHLADQGAMPNSLARAMALWGVALESEEDVGRTAGSPDYADYLHAHINDELAFDELEDMAGRILVGVNAISDSASNKIAQFCQALSQGYAIGGAIQADGGTFQGYDGTTVLDSQGNSPDHWIYFAPAYRTNAAGKKEFLLVNSWSPAWGLEGKAWVSENFINQDVFNALVLNLGV